MTGKQKTINADDQKTSIETTTSLNDCTPTGTLEEGDGQAISTIRGPNRDDAFALIDHPVKLACVIERSEDASGQYAGESYYPVAKSLQDKLIKHTRLVAFHPCLSQTGEHFILPQKLQLANSQQNSWNISLAEALSTPQGQWLRLWSDRGLQRYEFELVDIESDDKLEYPEFQNDLDRSLSENIIDSLKHPVIQHLLPPQNDNNGWEDFDYEV